MMWQVAPLSTGHLLYGLKFPERLISSMRCCSLPTLSVLELEVATVTGFPRTHMVIWLIWFTDPLGSSPSGSECSSSSLSGSPSSSYSSFCSSSSSSPSTFRNLFPLPLPLDFLPPFSLPLPLPPGLVGWLLALALPQAFSQDAFPSNLLLSDPFCHNGCNSWVLDNSQPDVPSFHSWSMSCPLNLF